MKQSLFTLLVVLFSTAAIFSQAQKPDYGRKFPKQIRLTEKKSTNEKSNLFKDYFSMTTNDEMRSIRSSQDELGQTHEKFQQYYKGLEVEGATYSVHSKNGVISLLTGDYFAITEMDVTPSISEAKALNFALSHVGASKYAWEQGNLLGEPDFEMPQGKLLVLPHPEGKEAPRLAYKFDIYALEPLYRAYVFIDAHTGEFIRDNLRIHHTNTPATGTSLYNGTVSFTADFTGTNYRLRQTSNGQGVETYNLNNGTNYTNATDFTSATSSFTGDATGVQAHYCAEKTHSYYLNEHNRNSYNNAGAKLKSYVHYSNNYVNAFWDGTRMTYGDGDGNNYGPLVSLDICGHEITHGVTEYSANLTYSYESGALNESFSDIFGECVEHFAAGSNDWLMGDQIGAGGSGGALRSMSNPNVYGDPDTYQGTNWYSGTGDNGGVHTNSGVQNKWCYILAMGETGTNDKNDSYR